MEEVRTIIADPDPQTRKTLKSILSQAGHMVIGEAEDSLNALKLIRTRQPDLVILDHRICIMDGIDLGEILDEDELCPVIIITPTGQYPSTQTEKNTPFAYVAKPVTTNSLIPVISLVIRNYNRVQALEQEIERLKESIEARKIVERAKGILMEKQGLNEAEAFRKIQRQSMNKRLSMKSVAKAIILAYDLEK